MYCFYDIIKIELKNLVLIMFNGIKRYMEMF